MNSESLTFKFPISDFDLSKLPIDAAVLEADPEMLREAVSDYYVSQFRTLGGEAQIAISNGVVNVSWIPEAGFDALVDHGIEMLKQGDFATGTSLLRSALTRTPNDPVVLFNLGMALSDQDELEEAIELLERLVFMEPENVRGWNALGVAQGRNKNVEAAEAALRRSLELDPDDGYAHRNLATILMRISPREGVSHYRLAAELLPDDQGAQYGYGIALLEHGDTDTSARFLKKAIELDPLTEIAEMARSAQGRANRMAARSAGSPLRADAITHCLSAMKLFADAPELIKQVTFEVATLGRSGLDINNPASKYTLKSLPGEFSGMQLVSYMYVGLRELSPNTDPGIDLSQEYEQAKKLFREQ